LLREEDLVIYRTGPAALAEIPSVGDSKLFPLALNYFR